MIYNMLSAGYVVHIGFWQSTASDPAQSISGYGDYALYLLSRCPGSVVC